MNNSTNSTSHANALVVVYPDAAAFRRSAKRVNRWSLTVLTVLAVGMFAVALITQAVQL